MITLFTTCKPFEGSAAINQTNALTSWTQIQPAPSVVVYGEEAGVATICKRLGLNNIKELPRNGFGLPMLNFMFSVTQQFSETLFCCYANADIIIVSGLTEAAGQLGAIFPDGFLGVCRRTNIDLNEVLSFTPDWKETVARLMNNGELYTPCSSDLFLFKRPLGFTLPPLTAGRPRWDNWMMWAACDVGLPVVDMTEFITIAHPYHEYGLTQTEGQRAFFKHKSAKQNETISAGKVFCLKQVQKAGNLWQLTNSGISHLT